MGFPFDHPSSTNILPYAVTLVPKNIPLHKGEVIVVSHLPNTNNNTEDKLHFPQLH